MTPRKDCDQLMANSKELKPINDTQEKIWTSKSPPREIGTHKWFGRRNWGPQIINKNKLEPR